MRTKRNMQKIKQDIIKLYREKDKMRFNKLIIKANLSSDQINNLVRQDFLVREKTEHAVFLYLNPKINPFEVFKDAIQA